MFCVTMLFGVPLNSQLLLKQQLEAVARRAFSSVSTGAQISRVRRCACHITGGLTMGLLLKNIQKQQLMAYMLTGTNWCCHVISMCRNCCFVSGCNSRCRWSFLRIDLTTGVLLRLLTPDRQNGCSCIKIFLMNKIPE